MKIPFLKPEGDSDREVITIEINKIKPNPYQPRGTFNKEDIVELANSIKNYGMIQPLTVRKKDGEYELIAGERRLRASKHLGYEEVPAIVKKLNDQETAEIALVENLQRKDLDFLEEAAAYATLLNQFDLTQQELAERLGKSQSAIANKLRILTLSAEVREKLKSPLISERHARALLKIDDRQQQLIIIEEIKNKELTVRETEKLIEKIRKKAEKEKGKVVTVYKDLRIFTNTLNKTIREMKKTGLEVKVDKKEEEDYIEYRIRLPRKGEPL